MDTLKIHGTVHKGGTPVEGAYLDLCKGEDFIAERRTGPDGTFEFHTTPGDWVVVCRAAGTDPVRKDVAGPAGALEANFDL